MAYASYSLIGGPEGLLARREPFQGNSMRAEWIGRTYTVWSYRTVIAEAEQDGGVTHNEQRYSVTTSHHQNLCRAWLVPEDVARERILAAEQRALDLRLRAEAADRERAAEITRDLPELTLIGPAAGAQLRALVYGGAA